MFRIVSFVFCLLVMIKISAQDDIKWYTWEEGMVKSEKEHKKFVIDLYTDWCGWCKKMDATTFSDPEIVAYVNEHYIAIRFDAERKKEILFKGEKYSFVNKGRRGYHEFAAKLTKGHLSYPTIVFLDEEQELIQAIPGFQGIKTFTPILHYFSFDMHKKMPWANFLREFNANRINQELPSKNHGILVGQKGH